MTFLAQDETLALWAILFALTALGFWVDNHPRLKKTSGALWVIVGGVLLSNFQLTPFSSGSYQFVFQYLIPLAIPLLLFKANLGRIFRESGKVMLTFMCASLSTVIAAVAALYFVELGGEGAQLAGVIASGYIGGTMNFVAVSQAVGMDPELFGVAIGANSVVSVMALMALIAIPTISIIRRLIPSKTIDDANKIAMVEQEAVITQRFRLTHISFAIGLSFMVCALSYALAAALGIEQYSILFVTALAVVLASVAPGPLGKLECDFELGMLMMYLFFAAVGLSTNVTAFVDSALNLFFYCLVLVVLHLLLVLLMAKVFRFDLAEALTGSAAALVGPGPTAAIASANGWKELVTPGIVCGLFGYIIANFIGVTITNFLE
tara:strand:- start:8926 stop:10059 length:1134 start_codon:yes stop_codon:yes gene_type:complete